VWLFSASWVKCVEWTKEGISQLDSGVVRDCEDKTQVVTGDYFRKEVISFARLLLFNWNCRSEWYQFAVFGTTETETVSCSGRNLRVDAAFSSSLTSPYHPRPLHNANSSALRHWLRPKPTDPFVHTKLMADTHEQPT
jgi:hypothetical protein